MLDAFTMARLRRFADPAAFPPLSFGAAPIAPAPQPWTPQSEAFAPIDEAIANVAARTPPLAPADAAFSLPRGDALSLIDFGEQPMADAPWHQPFVFEPIEALAKRLDPYRQPTMTANGGAALMPSAQHASPLDTGMMERLARYRGAGPVPSRPVDARADYSKSTREKIADVQAFNPPKSEMQLLTETLLEMQRVNPAAWRLGRPADLYWVKDIKKNGLSPMLQELFFKGPNGEIYDKDSIVLEDGWGSIKNYYDELSRSDALSEKFETMSLGELLADMGPELAMALLARPGRRGGQPTQDHVLQIEKLIKRLNPHLKHESGGTMTEKAVKGPGAAWEGHPDGLGGDWKPGSLFADLVFSAPDGQLIAFNTVDVDGNGQITQRELDAARALHRMGYTVYLVKKPHQLSRGKAKPLWPWR